MEIDLKNLNRGLYEIDCYLAVNSKEVRDRRFIRNVAHIFLIIKSSLGKIAVYTKSNPVDGIFVVNDEKLFTELSEAEIYSEFLNSPD